MVRDGDLQYECGEHIADIMKNFTGDCKFTLIVRKPDSGGRFVMTSDDLHEVAKVIAKEIDAISQH
jgi:hypothetical protein